MKPYDYDTVDGITKQVSTLDGLHEWINERHKAGYGRKERLSQFIVLNRWVADTCGNVSRILEMEPRIRLAPVVNMDVLLQIAKIRLSHGGGMGPLLPNPDAKCEVCGIGWTLDNTHEHSARRGKYDETINRDTYTFYHTKCWRIFQLKEEHDHFAEIFKNAGYDIAVLTQTPNQYWPGATDRDYAAPWFHVDTKVGRFLIGWRKRVIHIEWKEIDRDLLCLFDDVGGTMDSHYIHAYSPKTASEYLARIRVALDPKTAKEFEIWSEYQMEPDRGRRPGWGLFHGKSRGVSFLDACLQFFKDQRAGRPGEDNIDYWEHDNKFNGARLFPSEAEARAASGGIVE